MSINHQSPEAISVTEDKRPFSTIESFTDQSQQKWQHKDFLQLILEKASATIINTKDEETLTISSYQINLLLPKGENYCGKLYRIDIEYNHHRKKASFVLKDLPDGEYCQIYVRETKFFEREIEFYQNTKPQLEVYFPIPAPNAYFVDSKQNFLIMDNLNGFGYRMTDRHTQLDLDHCKIALECLAKLHSVSYKFRTNLPEIYKESMLDLTIVKSFCESAYAALTEVVSQWTNDYNFGNKMKNINLWERLKEVCEYKPNKFNVLNHGDFWINNILFKYSGTIPIDAKMIDYQKCRFNSPVLDLHEFFFTSVQNLDDINILLKFYYEKLGENFLKLNLNLDQIYSWIEFRNDFNEKLFFGYYSACAVLSAVCAKPENLIDLTQLSDDENENLLTNIYRGEHFKRLFLERLKYFEQRNIL